MSVSADLHTYSASPNPITIIKADITTLDVDAMVNATNEALLPGGGFCDAIHATAGPELARACKPLTLCPTGEARLTRGFNLRIRHLIHTVGPVWHGSDEGEPELQASCYRNSIARAREHGLQSIAFPAYFHWYFRLSRRPCRRNCHINFACTHCGRYRIATNLPLLFFNILQKISARCLGNRMLDNRNSEFQTNAK